MGQPNRRPSRRTAAHKTLPLGTVVRVKRTDTGQTVRVVINDRGPYGAVGDDGAWRVDLEGTEQTRYRGILDMSIATARALTGRPSGLQSIVLRYWQPRRARRFDLAIWPAR